MLALRLAQPGRGSRSGPGTNDVWVGDRGGGYWEEIDRVPEPTDPVRNFGWPCYEGGIDANGEPVRAHPARAATTRT